MVQVEGAMASAGAKEEVRDVFATGSEDEGEGEIDYAAVVKNNMFWLLMVIFKMQMKTFKGDNYNDNEL